MIGQPFDRETLVRLADSVGERQGWSFARVRAARDPVPWHYGEIVRRYLTPAASVLDIGTGGGEKFLSLAPYFRLGVGVDADPRMVEVARRALTPTLAEKVAFEQMPADALNLPDDSFDIVLNRHAPISPEEVMRVLRPGGVFVTQQVGPRSAHNVIAVFGCTSGGQYRAQPDQALDRVAGVFEAAGCAVIARAEYDVPYWFSDIASFVFWLKAVPIPEDFDIRRHWEHVGQILAASTTPRGIQTNEQRLLLIARKPA